MKSEIFEFTRSPPHMTLAEPAGFIIENDGLRLGICTDLGIATNLVKVKLKGCHGLVLEANHDVDRLLGWPISLVS